MKNIIYDELYEENHVSFRHIGYRYNKKIRKPQLLQWFVGGPCISY